MMKDKVEALFKEFEGTVSELAATALLDGGRFGKIDPVAAMFVTKGYNCYVQLARTIKELAEESDERDRVINEKLDVLTRLCTDAAKTKASNKASEK